jgi:hypothetical protein
MKNAMFRKHEKCIAIACGLPEMLVRNNVLRRVNTCFHEDMKGSLDEPASTQVGLGCEGAR